MVLKSSRPRKRFESSVKSIWPFDACIYLVGIGTFVLAVALWLIDQRLCAHVQALPVNPQLHAAWHMLCAVSCYNVFLWVAFIRERTLKREPKLGRTAGGWLPAVVV